MGCDIHIMTEYRKTVNDKQKWVNCDNWRPNPYYGEFEDETKLELYPIFSDRNYELFSFLADVRNYGNNPSFGFDRGIPDDASPETIDEYKGWGEDAHTHGYCTLKELKEAVAGVKTVRREGAVSKDQADRFRETGQTPDRWAQGIGCWKGIDPKYADKYEWMVWEDEVHCFDRLLERLEARKREVFWIFDHDNDDGKHDDEIRIVFWFDN